VADYFQQLSYVIPLSASDAEAAAQFWKDLCVKLEAEEDGDDSTPWPTPFAPFQGHGFYPTGLEVDVQAEGLWIHDEDGSPNVACAAEFTAWVLETYAPERAVLIEWGNTCTKPRLDAFGGGVALVTAQGIEYRCTGSIGDELVMAWERRHGRLGTPLPSTRAAALDELAGTRHRATLVWLDGRRRRGFVRRIEVAPLEFAPALAAARHSRSVRLIDTDGLCQVRVRGHARWIASA
jgi:hypothetical protein